MQLTDSKEKLLKGPEIVTQAAYNISEESDPDMWKKLAGVGIELQKKGADVVQIGNTVFLSHRGKGNVGKRKCAGRIFNVDTPRNFMVNVFKYATYMQKQGVTHYSVSFTNESFITAFKMFERAAEGKDTQVAVGKLRDGSGYMGYIKLGKQPLGRNV